MPIYEYRCKACKKQFELMRTMAQMNAPAPCPACESRETMRQLSLFAAQTKGAPTFSGESCATSEAMGMPCCGGGCRLPNS
jgi:putative FmdB family regulatory protein